MPDKITPQESALIFPCDFPIKIFGLANENFEKEVLTIVKKHVPSLSEGALQIRDSKKSKYRAITVTIKAQNQEQLDAIYRELSQNSTVLMVL